MSGPLVPGTVPGYVGLSLGHQNYIVYVTFDAEFESGIYFLKSFCLKFLF